MSSFTDTSVYKNGDEQMKRYHVDSPRCLAMLGSTKDFFAHRNISTLRLPRAQGFKDLDVSRNESLR